MPEQSRMRQFEWVVFFAGKFTRGSFLQHFFVIIFSASYFFLILLIMVRCAVAGCGYDSATAKPSESRSLFKFPLTNEKLKVQWVAACRREFAPTPNTRICEKHFSTEKYCMEAGLKRRRLRQDAVPDVMDEPPSPPSKKFCVKTAQRQVSNM